MGSGGLESGALGSRSGGWDRGVEIRGLGLELV